MAPFLSRLGSTGGGSGSFGFARRRRRIRVKVPFAQYLFTGAQQTSIFIPQNATELVFAGVAMGGRGLTTNAISSTPTTNGGGGGSGNLAGWPVLVNDNGGQTLYIGVGGPTIVINTYARVDSHSGPSLFELGRGAPGDAGGAGGNGGMFGTPGAAGGGNATNVGAGGGNVVNLNPQPTGAGGNGGTTTQSGPLLQPINLGPTPSWTWNGPQAGGAGAADGPLFAGGSGASGSASGSGIQCYGPNYPGRSNNYRWAVGSGGGGGGVMINGTGYGGGGGAKGGGGLYGSYTGPAPIGSPPNVGGPGGPGFLIVQIYELQ